MTTIEQLLELAETQEPPETAIPFLEQAVRLADSQKDRAAAFRARVRLIQATTFSGFPDKALIHFAWVLGTFDRHPAEFRHQAYHVMWMYKWMLSASLDHPGFPLERIARLEADFERRTREQGSGAHYLAYHRLLKCKQLGDVSGAQTAFLAWRSLPRDGLSDCEACEQNKVMDYYAWRGNQAAAVRLGQEIISKGMSCHNVPTVTHANLLGPLLALGRSEEARHAHTEGLRMARLDRNFIETIGKHVLYLMQRGDLEAARDVWAEHLYLALGLRNQADLFEFMSVSAALWNVLSADQASTVRLPRQFALYRPDGQYQPQVLATHFRREAEALAQRFDARNGTDHYHYTLTRTLALT
ncbi:hypothetical protein MF271_03790 [Deinococcus sp. KNUC1210]|uniref:hypothetical protein n=1 Tax=Deinococcus sp. KNUC1210 TaxID=2917691 RepID=UPI001EF0F103|nr:hypothetical protein [Deinococcus sp. KNUC1210]ULH15769.1 hypothetical protein MF271_03790 [Deinococcus sp. KNUC1210]